MMIFQHVHEELAADHTIVGSVIAFTAVMSGAAAFMLCMGIGTRYSRHGKASDFMARGFEILTIGQLLNLLRDSIPDLILWKITGNQVLLSCSLLVFQTDILTFAGAAFLLLALLKYLKLSGKQIVIIGVIMNTGAFLLSFVFETTGNYLLDMLLGVFVVTSAESYFPLCCYFIFVAAGYYLGEYYLRICDKDGLSSQVLKICLPVIVIYYLLRFYVPVPFLQEFLSVKRYILNPVPDAIINIMSTICLIALFYKVQKKARDGIIPKTVQLFSKNINKYYCISYLMITPVGSFMYAYRGTFFKGMCQPLLYSLLVLAVTTIIVLWDEKRNVISISGLKGIPRKAVYIAIWAVSFLVAVYVYPQITEYANIWNHYLA